MKNKIKLFGIIALVAIIGFSMAACDNGTGGGTGGTGGGGTGGGSTYSINGVWERSQGERITISGSTGVFNAFGSPSAVFTDAVNKNYITLGGQRLRSITSTGNLTWSGQVLNVTFYTSAPNVAIGTSWENCTITMSADGQTLTVTAGSYTLTYTRSSHSLDGVWERSQGERITVSGSTGVFNAFGSPSAVFTDAVNKNYITLGGQRLRSITSTGNLTWSGQVLNVTFYTSAPNVAIGTSWENCTITMSADGQTLTVTAGSYTLTYTRKQ